LCSSETLADLVVKSAAELLKRTERAQAARISRTAGPHLVSVTAPHEVQLKRVVELEIIPRLMLMHGAGVVPSDPGSSVFELTQEHVGALAGLAVDGDAGAVSSWVQSLIDAGASAEQVFLDLLAPCARQLGELWEDDRYDFSQVTIGLWRLQQVLYEQSRRFNLDNRGDGRNHRALMAAVPGSQHTFGVTMAAEFFARAGWEVQCLPQTSWQEMQGVITAEWVDMVGLSVGLVDSLPEVASAIMEIRRLSVNSQVYVLVGGPAAFTVPDLARVCGADACATAADLAVEEADRWVGRHRRQA
jgi:methanogenic corrinoid protein MtbC1